MFRRIEQYFTHILMAMIRGFIGMGIAAAVIVAGAFFLIAHHGPQGGIEVLLVVLVVGLSALLGAVVGLAWRLAHIQELTQTVDRMVHAGEEHKKK